MLKQLLSLALLAGSAFLTSPVLADSSNTTALNSPLTSSLSANWAGYVADTATAYSAVGASWVVPAPSGTTNTALATDATWVGIGGVRSTDLIQAGTQAVVQNGSVSYQAWYELLPDYQRIIPVAVHSGDSVTVSFNETSTNVWHLSFKNNTTGGDYEKNITYRSSLSSAEWIEEMPVMQTGSALSYIPLDNFGTVSFSGGYTIADGTRQTIAGSGAQSLTMSTRSAQTLAAPTTLADDSFSINRSTASAQTTQTSTRLAFAGSFSSRIRHRGSGGRQIIVVTFGG